MRLDNFKNNQILKLIFLSNTNLKKYLKHRFVKSIT